MILYKNGHALIDDRLVRTDIVANHGRIIEISPEIVADEQTEVIDCTDRYLLPALVDLCSYGANGLDFNTADANGMKKILEYYISHGVGTVFPTLKTDTDEKLCRQLALIATLAKEYPEIKGIHLDGPFISPNHCDGALVPTQQPSMDKFLTYQKAAEGKIKLITLAPELPNAISFISELSADKVTVSLGRSDADADTVYQAIHAGAVSVTDWCNDMSLLSANEPGIAGSALLHGLYTMTVFDGQRVAPDMLKLLVKVGGTGRVAGITLNTADAYQGLANTVTLCGLRLAEAIKIWTTTPARMVGLQNRIGTIEINKDADFIMFG